MKKFAVAFIETEWYSMNIEDPNDFVKALNYCPSNLYITFQTSDLIREFKARRIKTLPKIVDLESFDKQMSQEGREFRGNRDWKALGFLGYHKVIDAEFKLSIESIESFLGKISFLYDRLLKKDEEEKRRFENIEIEINKLIFERQGLGVRIHIDIAKQRCAEIERKIYSIKNRLQLKYKVFTPNNLEAQKYYLEKHNYRIIKSYRYTFEIHKKDDEVCELFYELIRNEQDLDSLLFIVSHWGGQDKTFPSFLGFGTITSRIILRQPSLQNLRRTNRDIIIPDKGMKFLYIDYSQFEAGILASLSNDSKLIALYNSDIYEDLAEKVLKNKALRKEAKIIFYRYMYGDDSLNKEATSYFQHFKELEKFKVEVEKELKEKKKIGTKFGNYRNASNDDNIWVLSHVVQSTASYIYKKALLNVQKEERNAEFLIPMHDGTVYQINELVYDETKAKIERIYKDTFKEVCPQIEPRLNCTERFE